MRAGKLDAKGGNGRTTSRKSGDWGAKIKLHTSGAIMGEAALNGSLTS
jgi:hypothetical protein